MTRMRAMPSLSIRNGEPAPLTDVPALTVDDFREGVLVQVRRGARIAALFGQPLESDHVRLIAVLAHGDEGTLSLSSTVVADAYPALTPDCAEAHWFEREIAEQWNVRPLGHPWLKRIRFHPTYRNGQHGWLAANHGPVPLPGVTEFFTVAGEEVHEVAVGPVHAGIIEPGHFRFSIVGEKVLKLEQRLGYVHKGIEHLFAHTPLIDGHRLAARVSGDSAVAYSWAYCQSVEGIARTAVPPPTR